MNPALFSDKFALALPYDGYVRTGTDEQQRRWRQVYEQASFTREQMETIGGFARKMNILVISGIWCGDCVQQCPLIEKLAQRA